MNIEWFRDLIISIVGVVASGVLIFIAVLLYSLYHRTRSILDSIKATSTNIQRLSSYTVDEVAKPVIQMAALIQGIRQGIDSISKFFTKQEGGKDV